MGSPVVKEQIDLFLRDYGRASAVSPTRPFDVILLDDSSRLARNTKDALGIFQLCRDRHSWKMYAACPFRTQRGRSQARAKHLYQVSLSLVLIARQYPFIGR